PRSTSGLGPALNNVAVPHSRHDRPGKAGGGGITTTIRTEGSNHAGGRILFGRGVGCLCSGGSAGSTTRGGGSSQGGGRQDGKPGDASGRATDQFSPQRHHACANGRAGVLHGLHAGSRRVVGGRQQAL